MYIHLQEVHNEKSAKEILPILFKIFYPNSVIDVGCGTGSWLKVCNELGVNEITGIDGDYVDRSKLLISSEKFLTQDLEKPFQLSNRFDLIICLEVAEHISSKAAGDFILNLTNLGDIILFSAAVPNQGGQGHINEQWPSYWQEKFKIHGYQFYDLLRPLIWDKDSVEWWYKQNTFLVIKDGHNLNIKPTEKIIRVIHPDLFNAKINIIKKFKHAYKLRDWEFDQVDFKPINLREALRILLITLKGIFYLKK